MTQLIEAPPTAKLLPPASAEVINEDIKRARDDEWVLSQLGSDAMQGLRPELKAAVLSNARRFGPGNPRLH